MKILWILLVAQIANFKWSCAQDKISVNYTKCCSEEKNLLINNKCVPDKSGKSFPIALKCEKFVLDPNSFEDDRYNVTETGLFVFDLKSTIQPDHFCLVDQHDEEMDETHEIAIVCFPDEDAEISLSKLKFTFKAILIFTSVLFLLLTLYVYFRLPELRETQDKVTIFTLINLTTFLFFLGTMQMQTPVDILVESCVALAFIVYFFTMAYFAWLNCVMANVWKTVVLRNWKVQERHWYALNHFYGWSVPCAMTAIVAMKHHIQASVGVSTCWFHADKDQWRLVYLPISIMLTLNVVFCLWTSLCLINNDFSPDTRKALRYKCLLYLKIFLLGGFTWIFEVLSYTFNDHAPSAWLWVVVDSFNCLHGVLVFFVLVIWRQRIRKELAGKKILCYVCPAKWADVDDEEEICLENEGKGKYDLIIKSLK